MDSDWIKATKFFLQIFCQKIRLVITD